MSIILNKNDIVEVNKKEEYIILNKFKCKNIKTDEICDISSLRNKEVMKVIAIQEEFNI